MKDKQENNCCRSFWCPGMNDVANGMAVVARLLAADKNRPANEFIVHGAWSPRGWLACLRRGRGKYVRMPHGSYSPVYLEHQSKWKKRLVAPVERWLLLRSGKIIVTCEAEKVWTERFVGRSLSAAGVMIEVVDLKKYWHINQQIGKVPRSGVIHALYLGRRHPLKGVDYLETACAQIENCELKVVCNARDMEKEAAFSWADIVVLPTLSENFGIVVAEALEHGLPVITTDGAPAWEGTAGVTYLKGFRVASDGTRVAMLRDVIAGFLENIEDHKTV